MKPLQLLPLALVVLATLVTSSEGSAQAAAATISGQVMNGTADGSSPANLPVKLHMFRERSRLGELTTTTDATGRFRFDQLETGPDHVYFPVVDYGGVSYFPDRPITMDGPIESSVQIRVFEPTGNDSGIKVDRANLLVLGVDPSAITFMEMGAVANSTDRTLVPTPSDGGSARTLRFALPTGATQLVPQVGFSANSVVPTAEGFITTDPITPGRHEMAYSYQLPLAGGTLDVIRRQFYPVGDFNLYVPDTGVKVASPQLVFQGTADLGGQKYQLFSAGAVPGDTELAIRLTGLRAGASLTPTQTGMLVVGGAALALGGALVWSVSRRSAEPGRTRIEPNVDRHRSVAVAEIAALDDRFARGEIEADVYNVERRERTAELVDYAMRARL